MKTFPMLVMVLFVLYGCSEAHPPEHLRKPEKALPALHRWTEGYRVEFYAPNVDTAVVYADSMISAPMEKPHRPRRWRDGEEVFLEYRGRRTKLMLGRDRAIIVGGNGNNHFLNIRVPVRWCMVRVWSETIYQSKEGK